MADVIMGNRFAIQADLSGPVPDEVAGEFAGELVPDLEAILSDADVKRKEIRRNPGLNDLGRQEESRRVALRADEMMAKAAAPLLEKLQTRIERKQGRLDSSIAGKPKPTEDPVVAMRQEMRGQEIRELFRRMPETERAGRARESIRAGDRDVWVALSTAPPSLRSFGDDEWEDLRNLYAKTHYPELVDELRGLRTALSAVKFNIAQGRRHLGLVPDPTAKMVA